MGLYLVREDSPVRSNVDVDALHNRVAVGKGSAYDLFLTRELKAAQIVRAPTSPTVVQTFIEQGLEVAAGVKQQLQADASQIGGLRLLDERFMVIRQAMGVAKSRGAQAAAVLADFVEQKKASSSPRRWPGMESKGRRWRLSSKALRVQACPLIFHVARVGFISIVDKSTIRAKADH